MKEAVSVDGVRTSTKRELWGRESKKKHTSKQERKHCLLIPFHHNNKQTNKQTKGLGAKDYLTESGPQVIMATRGYRNLSCTGGNSSPRNQPIVLAESFLCPHAEK